MATFNDLAALDGPLGLSPKVTQANWINGIFEATREVECAWADRVAVYNQIINTEYPYIPSTNAYAFNAKMEGWGASSDAGSGLVSYEKAKITFFYTNRIWFLPGAGNAWITETLTPVTQYRKGTARSFHWESSTGTPVRFDEEPVSRAVYLQYNLTYYKLPQLPTAILTHQGATNIAAVASYTLGLTFGAETIVLAGSPATRTFYSSFNRGWKLTYFFDIFPEGANKFWRAETEAWEAVYEERKAGGTQYKPYPPKDFTLLVP